MQHAGEERGHLHHEEHRERDADQRRSEFRAVVHQQLASGHRDILRRSIAGAAWPVRSV